MDKNITGLRVNNEYLFLGFTIIIYFATAYYSVGFNNPDEHFQIIEFANYKLGNAGKGDLAWEFDAQIRSGLQPLICYLIFKMLTFLKLGDPYFMAFTLRAISATFSLLVIWKFVLSCRLKIEKDNWLIYLVLSFFLWFLPYINVRFSSETWSGLLIVYALSIVYKNDGRLNIKSQILMGLLLGFSILCRYQSAILALGLCLWLLLVMRIGFKGIFCVCAMIFGVLIIGILIDFWLYGNLTVTLYNYFCVNIVNDVASQYGVQPWYEILNFILKGPGIFGPVIFFSFLLLTFFKPKEPLVWVILPFLLIHMVIPHKEIRFLFPLVNLVPLIVVLGFQVIKMRKKRSDIFRGLVFLIALLLNFAGIFARSFRGADRGKISITSLISKSYQKIHVNVFFTDGNNPYSDWVFPKNTFYKPSDVSLKRIRSIWDVPDITFNKSEINLIVLSSDDITGPKASKLVKTLGLQHIYSTLSWYCIEMNKIYDPNMNNILMVYKVN